MERPATFGPVYGKELEDGSAAAALFFSSSHHLRPPAKAARGAAMTRSESPYRRWLWQRLPINISVCQGRTLPAGGEPHTKRRPS